MAVTIGIFLGCISGFFQRNTGGLVIQAVILTFGSALSMIWLYKNKFITVNNHFIRFTLLLVSVISWSIVINFIMSIVDLNWQSLYKGDSTTAIILNVVTLVLGYMVFILDLNVIEEKLRKETASAAEIWFFSIELLIDVAWIYLAFIFIIMRLRGRRS